MLSLEQFFVQCLGQWHIERTYHYLKDGRSERSQTNYDIRALSPEGRQKVLADNQQPEPLNHTGGFYLAFDTTSETGEQVAMALNILFIPQLTTNSRIEGLYLRDRAYEEDRPITSQFCYEPERSEMLMTTPYSRVVSVDSIIFVNPDLRLRRIINYRRTDDPLTEPLLIGFGVERRV